MTRSIVKSIKPNQFIRTNITTELPHSLTMIQEVNERIMYLRLRSNYYGVIDTEFENRIEIKGSRIISSKGAIFLLLK